MIFCWVDFVFFIIFILFIIFSLKKSNSQYEYNLIWENFNPILEILLRIICQLVQILWIFDKSITIFADILEAPLNSLFRKHKQKSVP